MGIKRFLQRMEEIKNNKFPQITICQVSYDLRDSSIYKVVFFTKKDELVFSNKTELNPKHFLLQIEKWFEVNNDF
jgi:hypothetical protein